MQAPVAAAPAPEGPESDHTPAGHACGAPPFSAIIEAPARPSTPCVDTGPRHGGDTPCLAGETAKTTVMEEGQPEEGATPGATSKPHMLSPQSAKKDRSIKARAEVASPDHKQSGPTGAEHLSPDLSVVAGGGDKPPYRWQVALSSSHAAMEHAHQGGSSRRDLGAGTASARGGWQGGFKRASSAPCNRERSAHGDGMGVQGQTSAIAPRKSRELRNMYKVRIRERPPRDLVFLIVLGCAVHVLVGTVSMEPQWCKVVHRWNNASQPLS